MENMNNEIIETTEIDTTDINYNEVEYDEAVESNGNGGKLLVIGGVIAAGAVALAVTQGKKIMKWCEDKTLAKAEKIMAKRALKAAEEDYVDEDVIDAEVIDTEDVAE